MTDRLADVAARAGIEHVRVLAWRDVDHPEAGGSERHADALARRWAAAGIEVTVRTSAVGGVPSALRRGGYTALRRGGRYSVFARGGAEALWRRPGPREALVEIWNGMPFFSPLWWRGPRLVLLHQVHADLWQMVLPGGLARLGETIETRLAPRLYRNASLATLSASSRDEIVARLGLPAEHISVIPPGVDERFSPGGRGEREQVPLVVAVGRLVPMKRFDLLMRACAHARRRVEDLRLVIVGDGYDRPRLEAERASIGAGPWTTFVGRASDAEVASWYRRAWVVASTSQREGWGMTLTEAAACATPAVATAIAGHRDAVADGQTGLLARDEQGISRALVAVLSDETLRHRLGEAARVRAGALSWDRAALETLQALAASDPAARAHPDGGRGLRNLTTRPTTVSAPRKATAAPARLAAVW